MVTKVKTFKNLLLPKQLLDSIIILQECSLDRGLQNTFKKIMTHQKSWLFMRDSFFFIMVLSKMNLQRFWTSPREITFGKLLKSQYKLLPCGALCNLIAKMRNSSKFWSIKFMDANFFYCSINDRYIQRKPSACVHATVNFSFKNSSETIFAKFHSNVP